MKQIDVYDFDKTVIPYDSGSRFAFYCFAHYPWCFPVAPVVGVMAFLSLCGIIKWGTFKKVCFSFMAVIPRDRAVKGFWDRHEKDIYPWFYERPREALIISASPDFLLKELQKRVGFEGLICTVHNKKTGAIIGKNCAKEEKLNRFHKEINENDVEIIDVYSDSLTNDAPLFSLATGKCYHIVKGERLEFNYSDVYEDK